MSLMEKKIKIENKEGNKLIFFNQWVYLVEELFKIRGKGGVLRELTAEVLRVKRIEKHCFCPKPSFYR